MGENGEPGSHSKKRPRIRPEGTWYRPLIAPGHKVAVTDQHSRQVQMMSTLPLKAMSRLWGKFNELDIPYYLRVPGFRLYSFIFGVK